MTSILSEQEFVDIINRLRKVSDLREQVNEIFHNSRENIENDFCNAAAIDIHTPELLYDFISNNGFICQKEV